MIHSLVFNDNFSSSLAILCHRKKWTEVFLDVYKIDCKQVFNRHPKMLILYSDFCYTINSFFLIPGFCIPNMIYRLYLKILHDPFHFFFICLVWKIGSILCNPHFYYEYIIYLYISVDFNMIHSQIYAFIISKNGRYSNSQLLDKKKKWFL